MIQAKEGVCDFCGACIAVCPQDCIEMGDSYIHIDDQLCSQCLLCIQVCPIEALEHIPEGETQ